jgi:hypothetical protein
MYEKFADQVGWRTSEDWLSYEELTFLFDGSKHAHLPVLLGGFGREWRRRGVRHKRTAAGKLFSRRVKPKTALALFSRSDL